MEEFLSMTEAYTHARSADLANLSFKVEEGVKDLTTVVTRRSELMLSDCTALAEESLLDGTLSIRHGFWGRDFGMDLGLGFER